jgi:oligopeptide transport system ATP-binding protein
MTMLSVMGLLPSPAGKVTGGEVWFEGHDLLRMGDRQRRRLRGNQIAMIFQDPMMSLNPVMRISRQLTEAIQQHTSLDRRSARARAVELLAQVGIADAPGRVDYYPHQFSGGMRQRVMIAMGLACRPALLIADEPTTALDVTIQAQIVDLVKGLRRDLAMAVIWITHDLSLLAGLADRILVMYAGQIIEQAPVQDLYRHPRHPYTAALLQSIPRLDRERQAALRPIVGMPPSLTTYPQGCAFADRCRFVQPACRQATPPWRRLAPIIGWPAGLSPAPRNWGAEPPWRRIALVPTWSDSDDFYRLSPTPAAGPGPEGALSRQPGAAPGPTTGLGAGGGWGGF